MFFLHRLLHLDQRIAQSSNVQEKLLIQLAAEVRVCRRITVSYSDPLVGTFAPDLINLSQMQFYALISCPLDVGNSQKGCVVFKNTRSP